MQNNILTVDKLTKKYKDFTLEDVSFSLPYGSIIGLIGENGAGKSTIIKAITEVINKDDGKIALFGRDEIEPQEKCRLAVVFDSCNFPEMLNVKKLNKVMKNIYDNWDEDKFFTMVGKFNIPTDKNIKGFSKGMKTKLSLIVAFSHGANLMILDEATSGLDPVIRDEILDTLLDFVGDENNSVLISSHITTDLEKIADYIVFIHQGKLIFNIQKDELKYNYALLKCGKEDFNQISKEDIIKFRELDYSYEILVSNRDKMEKKYPKFHIETITIDEIMLLYIKGGNF